MRLAWALLLLLVAAACGEAEPSPGLERGGGARTGAGGRDAATLRGEAAAREAVEREGVAAERAVDEPAADAAVSDAGAIVVRVLSQVDSPEGRHAGSVRVAAGLRARVDRKWRRVAGVRQEGATNADGRATFTFARPSGADESARFGAWVQVIEPGYQETVLEKRAPDSGEQVFDAIVVATPGGTAHGTVYDPGGAPVGYAHLQLVTADGKEVPQTWYSDHVSSDRDGRFLLHFGGLGPFTLKAGRASAGSTVVAGLALDPAAPPRDLRVDLEGSGSFAGFVRDSAGRPVAGFDVRASLADGNPRSTTGFNVEYAESGGLRHGRTRTNADGAFRISGLRDGAFTLVGGRGVAGAELVDLFGKPVRTSRDDLELVAVQHLVTVRAVDTDGTPLSFDVRKRKDPRTVVVTAVSCDASGIRTSVDQPPWVTQLADGARVLHVRPDVTYLLSAWSPERGAVERMVRVTDGDPLVEVDLQLGPARPAARLRADPRGPRGEEFIGEFDLIAHTPSGRAVGEVQRAEGSEAVPELELPPGRYRIAVVPARADRYIERVFWFADEVTEPAPYDLERAEAWVELGAGETRTITPNFGGVGAVQVLVELGVPRVAEPLPVVRAIRDGDERELQFPNGLHEDATDEQADGVTQTSHGPLDFRQGILPGLAQRSYTYLTEGAWTLRVELEGYAPIEKQVDVPLNDVTEVRFELRPKD